MALAGLGSGTGTARPGTSSFTTATPTCSPSPWWPRVCCSRRIRISAIPIRRACGKSFMQPRSSPRLNLRTARQNRNSPPSSDGCKRSGAHPKPEDNGGLRIQPGGNDAIPILRNPFRVYGHSACNTGCARTSLTLCFVAGSLRMTMRPGRHHFLRSPLTVDYHTHGHSVRSFLAYPVLCCSIPSGCRCDGVDTVFCATSSRLIITPTVTGCARTSLTLCLIAGSLWDDDATGSTPSFAQPFRGDDASLTLPLRIRYKYPEGITQISTG